MSEPCERRKQLRDLNQKAWGGELLVVDSPDTSLKSNMAVLKKLSSAITAETQSSLIDSIKRVSLEKYLDELIPATADGLLSLKKKDTTAAVEVLSVLHQRFSSRFTLKLALYFFRSVEDFREPEHLSVLGTLMRLYCEMYLVDLIRLDDSVDKSKLPRYLLKSDRPLLLAYISQLLSQHANNIKLLPIVSGFVKKFEDVLFCENELLGPSERLSLIKLFTKYSEHICKLTENTHREISSLVDQVNEISRKTGKVPESLESELKEKKDEFAKLEAYSEFAHEVFSIEKPSLAREAEPTAKITAISGLSESNRWESEEQRKFYEEVPDISEMVDPSLLLKRGPDVEEKKARKDELSTFIEQLDAATTAEEVDNKAREFWQQEMYTKSAESRLYRHAYSQNINSKAFARFLCINRNVFKALIQKIENKADTILKDHLTMSHIDYNMVRLYCEMANFNLVSGTKFLDILRVLVVSVGEGAGLDLLTLFFDYSRFTILYRPEYAESVNNILHLLQSVISRLHGDRQKAAQAFLSSLAVAEEKVQVDTAKPKIQFLDYMLKRALQNQAFFPALLEFEWDPESYSKIVEFFTHPESITYDEIPALVSFLKWLGERDPVLITVVVDSLVEEFQSGFELNDFRQNRKRMAIASYLAQLAIKRLITATLFRNIVKYAIFESVHGDPSNWFWAKMVCLFFELSKKDMPLELMLFDYHLLLQGEPPLDLNLRVVKCFESRGVKRSNSAAEAAKRISEISKAARQTPEPEQEDDEELDQEADELSDSEDTEDIGDSETEDESDEDDDIESELDENMINEQLEMSIQSEFDSMLAASLKTSSSANPRPRVRQPVGAIVRKEQTEDGANKFTFLTKSGNKIAARKIEVPDHVDFVAEQLTNAELWEQERDRIKDFVLSQHE
ncbi:hypothetical protein KL918_003391 [Ogataea parapolymorpha]|uniref:Nonsense-mediated mRNA decay protein 2 n=1 Tax=Ogataea parapolymorpha (strain ATCC 26012 / BCRC 20466 / JCM 22074 / NRRL Y-7560 / DL-1) TaxID=871575 RepID=W1Q6T4_OGAPD|nr:Nonsense-mediated mRNA decay protein 2 [Ogataea parapolymorpha DL-1]ESW95834.1 Nonsense-mediated mRNA decay protein 2 [Ogataea parapolymorpha DL-1]KAG7866494.1 hypothetical protein KL918_003391 [Ogataea parapolymorpha]KAG7872570.1 hypothetical protein KL916_002965 [Ogataea parapolymorpha]